MRRILNMNLPDDSLIINALNEQNNIFEEKNINQNQ